MQSSPELATVLDALDDSDCRHIVQVLDVARTANEIAELCDMPLSTTYRKLERLKAATLVEERTRLQSGGHHTHEYDTAFESIQITLEESRQLDISIVAPTTTVEAHLSTIWSEIRKEV